MGREDVEVLRERALLFLEAARDDLKAGRYDLAAFHSEQATQLALKYLLASALGHYPHTHSLAALFELVKAVREDVWRLFEENRMEFEVMEDAYIGGRYLPRRYSKEVAERLVKTAERLVELCTSSTT
ncbi:MAG: HEPN domain-containing protein [Thermoproteus sp.]